MFTLYWTRSKVDNYTLYYSLRKTTELKTLEWWISGLMLNPLFFLISRLNIACSPLIFNLQIDYPIRIKDIPFKSFQLWTHFILQNDLRQSICTLYIKKKIWETVQSNEWLKAGLRYWTVQCKNNDGSYGTLQWLCRKLYSEQLQFMQENLQCTTTEHNKVQCTIWLKRGNLHLTKNSTSVQKTVLVYRKQY